MVKHAAPSPKRPPAKFDSLEQEVFLGLWRTYDRLKAFEDELFARYELTAQQYNLLRLLGNVFPAALPTLELAGRLVSRAPDITRMLDKLEQRSLVHRERPPEDRRVVHVGLTEAGVKLLEALSEPLRKCHEKQLGHLSKTDLKSLSTLLRSARSVHEGEQSVWQ
ncbi:HTH-type transcriptional regulator MhqR [Caulifigura coniformis]|uniref:HTH-type transcriptional regulator MhqR n=1 Tax=Caulifigura coniformis TaxID=2527983 RepID=A0A517SHJ7_9PLAN|nr:MarR family transcriptional regulator [Caulifigura coniformis]QDT55599.1 HTH-type transcriptional regulator MhqR [Caulifigura coniformis]